MKKLLKKSNLLFVLACALIACLTCGGLVLTAGAQEEEPTSTVTFTSSTTVMKVDEEFEFAAEVTLADGTTTDAVTWSSSDEDVIYIEEGLATALAEGTATITATAEDGAFASVDVYVSETAVHVTSINLYPNVLELGVGWKTRVGYTVIPDNATDQRVTFASSDPSVITVDANGNVEALKAGNAIITVTAYDSGITATCDAVVYANLGEATLSADTLVTTVGQVEGNNLTVTLPAPPTTAEAVTVTYHWYSMYDYIASVDVNDDATGTIFSWNFGTTTIYVVATRTYTLSDSEEPVTERYAAMATVHVTSQYFYLTGLEEVLADPTDDPWLTYDTEEAAQDAGVLLVQDATNPYLFSITRSFWAFDNFQIIHSDIGEGWTTRITSRAFVEQGSSMAYIANDAETFAVNALGIYTVTLDLSDGPAKVTIEMDSLKVTSLDLSVASENAYLQFICAEEGAKEDAARTMVIDAYTIPELAEINPDDVTITTDPSVADYVQITHEVIKTLVPQEEEDEEIYEYSVQITLTLLQAVEANTSFQLVVEIDNHIDNLSSAINDITITILANGEEYVPVTSIAFTSKNYTVNVNNGAKAWVAPIEAVVNEGASVKDVVYSEDSDHLYIEYIDVDEDPEVEEWKPFVHADAFGVYTIYANALGNSKLEAAEATVLVTSLVEPLPEDEASGFYLIGRLDGVEVNNWTSISPDVTDFTGEYSSLFADWTLAVGESIYDEESGALISASYTGTFNFRAHDVFSIAFLGMNGDWDSIINNQYMDWDASDGTFWNNDINIEIAENGRYAVTLTIDKDGPSFSIRYVGVYNPETEYDLWLYVVRSGDSWNSSLDDEGNTLATVGFIHINNGVAESMTLTSEGYDFYTFYTTTGEWPEIQFVTAYTLDGTGIEGGYFQNATWYGSVHTGITFDGTAYSPTAAEDHFANREGTSNLYWIGQGELYDQIPASMAGKMTVEFTFTFDEGGVLTKVELNFVSATTEPAE